MGWLAITNPPLANMDRLPRTHSNYDIFSAPSRGQSRRSPFTAPLRGSGVQMWPGSRSCRHYFFPPHSCWSQFTGNTLNYRNGCRDLEPDLDPVWIICPSEGVGWPGPPTPRWSVGGGASNGNSTKFRKRRGFIQLVIFDSFKSGLVLNASPALFKVAHFIHPAELIL